MNDTMPPIYRPLMSCPTIRSNRCIVCGRALPLEQHHLVFRSQGKLFKDGKEIPKPTITLCGYGNNMPYCHGKVHNHMLHFKWEDDALWYLETDEPVNYLKALNMDGWKCIEI